MRTFSVRFQFPLHSVERGILPRSMRCRVEVTPSVNIGSAEQGALLCPCLPLISMENVDDPIRKKHFFLYMLIVIILIILLSILGLLFYESGLWKYVPVFQTNYEWQKSCDSRCAGNLGNEVMASIETMGCKELYGYTKSFPVPDSDYMTAMKDKLAFENCENPHVRYPWLSSCTGNCITSIGDMELSFIDADTKLHLKRYLYVARVRFPGRPGAEVNEPRLRKLMAF